MSPLFGYFSRSDFGQALRSQLLWPNWQGNWILGRHACLGRSVLDLIDIGGPIFNIQKGRVDYLISCINQNETRARTAVLGSFISRKDIIPLIRQQEYCNNLPKHPPKLVYMDSFAELADQLFIHREKGWGGCCYYTDVHHTEDFKILFEERGLLDLEKIESSYRNYFDRIHVKYGEVPILFLHFPSVLEKRLKYFERGQIILSTIDIILE